MAWTGRNDALSTSLTQEELEAMLQTAQADYTVKRIPKNAVIFWDSEPHDFHYYLIEGRVEIYTVDTAGRKKTIDIYGPGSFIGYHILTESNTPMTTACALEDCRVIAIPKQSFFRALHVCPEFADTTVRYLFGLLSMQTREVINSSFYVAGQRVPLLLLELAREKHEEQAGQGEIVLYYGNTEIAEMLGVSRNSVTASISHLQSQGAIEKQRNSIRVVDLDKLEKIAYFEHV